MASTMELWRLMVIPWWLMARRLLCPTPATQQRFLSVSMGRSTCHWLAEVGRTLWQDKFRLETEVKDHE